MAMGTASPTKTCNEEATHERQNDFMETYKSKGVLD
jgi:hypothetical protein